MSDQIEVSVDSQGCITIPAEIQYRLGLFPGMTLIVEEGEKGTICLRVQKDSLELVEKEGVLVVRAEAAGDIGKLTPVVGLRISG